jgi:RNA polymerase sigma factor (sigma-70 family)
MKYSYVNRKCEPEDCNLDMSAEEISEDDYPQSKLIDKTTSSPPSVHKGEGLYTESHDGIQSSLIIYFKAIRRFPLLNEETEKDVAQRLKECEERCTHLVIQWRDLFKNEFLKIFTATHKKEMNKRLTLFNGYFHLFDNLAKLEKERKDISGALKRRAHSFTPREELKERLYTVNAEISKCVVKISLSIGIVHRTINSIKEIPHNKKHTNERRRVEDALRKTLEEMSALLKDMKELKKELVHANQRLVICIAKKYAHHDIILPDLIQEGNLGLMRAIDTYDYRRGHRFITYATWWIRQAIIRALDCQSRTIRTPVHINEKFKKITKISHQLLQEYKGKPSLENIAKETNTPLESIEKVIKCFNDTISLDTCIDEGGNGVTTPPLGYPKLSILGKVISSDLSQHIGLMLSDLTLRERDIVKLRFGIGAIHDHTLEEIGEKFNLSRERIRQILEGALDKLRNHKHMIQLKDFIDFN